MLIRIKDLREDRDLTQKAMAEILGMYQQNKLLSNRELGTN